MNFKFFYKPFFVGLIFSIKIKFIGEVYIGELAACYWFIFNINKIRTSKDEKIIIIFGFLWSIAQLISDMVNGSELFDSVKGVMAPVIFIVTFLFILNYLKKAIWHLPSLLIGMTLGALAQLIFFPTEYFISGFWKWGVGSAVVSGFIILHSFFYNNKSNFVLITFMTIFFLISLYLDSRSLAIFPILSTIAYLKFYGKSNSIIFRRLTGQLAGFKILLFSLPFLFFINGAASVILSSEMVLDKLPNEVATKYRTQATGSFGVLLGGRSEILISAQAFLDKPLLGHGSWAKDNDGYLDRYSTLRHNLGYSLREDGSYEDVDKNNLIPAHSYLMSAFVWSGFMGGLFWLVVLNIALRKFVKDINLLPIYYYFGIVGFTWSVFFSPFGADGRWNAAIFLSALFVYSNYLKYNKDVRV